MLVIIKKRFFLLTVKKYFLKEQHLMINIRYLIE